MSLYDDLIKHKILLNKYSKYQSRQYLHELKQHKKIILKEIEKYGVLSYPKAKELHAMLGKGIPEIVKGQLQQLKLFYDYEQKFATRVLKKKFEVSEIIKTETTILDIASLKVPFSLYKAPVGIEDAYTNFTNKVLNRTFQIVNDGNTQGLNKQEVIQKIEELYVGLTKSQGFSLVGNTIAGVSGDAMDSLVTENPDLGITGQEWVSMLDDIRHRLSFTFSG